MCAFWEQGYCRKGMECPFAHNAQELDESYKTTDRFATKDFRPTKMCKMIETGWCKKGSECTFAHNAMEIKGGAAWVTLASGGIPDDHQMLLEQVKLLQK